jgi:hypothetical protein
MPSMIGLIMLMGIATKNSILLVDYVILARREHGLDRWNALLDACRKRARPIVMTTIAMGAGMLPIAIGIGTDPSFRAPMAIVVIGGLITSTFLSLLLRRRRPLQAVEFREQVAGEQRAVHHVISLAVDSSVYPDAHATDVGMVRAVFKALKTGCCAIISKC